MTSNFETQRDYENQEINTSSALSNLMNETIAQNKGINRKILTVDESENPEDHTEIEESRKIIEQGGDVRKIKRLTPELAQTLISKKNSEPSNWLYLYNLKALDKATAKELSKFKGYISFINTNDSKRIEYGRLKQCNQFCEQLLISSVLNKLEKEDNMKLGNLEYIRDGDSQFIKSYGKTVEVDLNIISSFFGSEFDCHSDYRNTLPFLIKGLQNEFTIKGGLWLSNFKNRVKSKYGNKKIEYKRDIINKNLSMAKTLCIGNTTLISRGDLEKWVWGIDTTKCRHVSDESVQKIVDWLNK